MVISVNGHPLALKKGSSFEYISENRLFSGSDAYTLSITFPLRDCPQNLKIFGNINRKDVSLGKIIFDCEIRDKSFYKFGSLTVVEISESEVKCQFLEGRSETNYDKTFDKVFINELDLGAPEITDPSKIEPDKAVSPSAMEFKYVALPWVNNNSDSGLPHNFVDINKVGNTNVFYYTWADSTAKLSWQPFLLYIIKEICREIKYTIDLSPIEDKLKFMIICNTLPPAWDVNNFARALPHWTIDEFFSNLELFLSGEFNIDHRNKNITFKFNRDIISDPNNQIVLSEIVEEYSSELSTSDNDCEYLDVMNLKYKGDDSVPWKYYSCQGILGNKFIGIKEYDRLADLFNDIKDLHEIKFYNQTTREELKKIFYAKDVDRYYIIRIVDIAHEDVAGSGIESAVYTCILQSVNFLGPRLINEDENKYMELLFQPVPVDYADKDYEFCMFLSPGSFDEDAAPRFNRGIYEGKTFVQDLIEEGLEESDLTEYYDCIYLGWWIGAIDYNAKMPYPVVDYIVPKTDMSGYSVYVQGYDFRLNSDSSVHNILYKIDPTRKVSFKFLSDTIPNVRAVFFIHGKRYICEKITATFTESGMSQLLKGDFYPLID